MAAAPGAVGDLTTPLRPMLEVAEAVESMMTFSVSAGFCVST